MNDKLYPVLREYAKLYVSLWPRSEMHHLPEMDAADKAVTKALDMPDWFADCSRLRKLRHIVTFYDSGRDAPLYVVNTATDEVTPA
jgi:hypothetical protein